MTTDKKPISKSTNSNTIIGTTLSSWSRQQQRQQKIAMIACLAILSLLLVASACSKQSPKPALVAVSSPVSIPVTATASAPGNTPSAASPADKTKPTAKKRPLNVTYNDATSGVSFLYPRRFSLATGDKAQPQLAAVGDVPMNFVEPGGVAVATIELPSSLYPGTDFQAAFFNVNVNHNVSQEQCKHFAFVDTSDSDGEPVDAEKIKVGSTEMVVTSNFTANVMKQAETKYYHGYENGACYEYVLGFGTEGFAEGGIQHVNRDEIFAKLGKILATVKIKPIGPEHVAESATSMGGGKE